MNTEQHMNSESLSPAYSWTQNNTWTLSHCPRAYSWTQKNTWTLSPFSPSILRTQTHTWNLSLCPPAYFWTQNDTWTPSSCSSANYWTQNNTWTLSHPVTQHTFEHRTIHELCSEFLFLSILLNYLPLENSKKDLEFFTNSLVDKSSKAQQIYDGLIII